VSYRVREIFSTLQGEGSRAGSLSVFVRFAGCNLWNGRPEDREKGKGACALWCDTDFVKGKEVSAEDVRLELDRLWGERLPSAKWCVLSGGEPLLQVDHALVDELQRHGWNVAIETNGTLDNRALDLMDHVCVSPKLGSTIERMRADELKVVLPGHVDFEKGWTDGRLVDLQESGEWGALYIQPQDPIYTDEVNASYLASKVRTGGRDLYERNLNRCLNFVANHPEWRLSLQVHKYARIP